MRAFRSLCFRSAIVILDQSFVFRLTSRKITNLHEKNQKNLYIKFAIQILREYFEFKECTCYAHECRVMVFLILV